jgi:hypothetical protein
MTARTYVREEKNERQNTRDVVVVEPAADSVHVTVTFSQRYGVPGDSPDRKAAEIAADLLADGYVLTDEKGT